ncbi:MAG: DUF748 domain-containing protein [Campylobacterota bacterium]|nr:DUF748 domain-containing protein [Campylobacterota bacterium]
MKKILQWIVISLFGLYLLFGYFILPYLITSQAPKIVQEQMGAHFDIKGAYFDPFGFELQLYDINFTSATKEPLLQLKELVVNIELYALFTGKIQLKKIALIEPKIFILKDSKGIFNFNSLLTSKESSEKPAQTQESKNPLPVVVMEHFYIKDASISYSDLSKKVPFSVAFDKLGMRVFDISTQNMHSSDGKIRFFTHINDGGFIDFRSKLVSLDPVVLEGSLDFESGKIFTGWSYLQEILNLEIADGKLHAHTDFFLNADDIYATRLEAIALRLEHLRIKPKEEHHDILHVKRVDLDDGVLFPLQQKGHFNTLSLDDIALHVKRHSDSSLNWEHYAKVASDSNKTAVSEPTEPSKSWDITLDRFILEKFHVSIHDEGISPSQHFKLNDFNLSAQNIHSLGGHSLEYQMALRFNEAMFCESQGKLQHSYLDGNGSFTCKDIDMTWFNAYVDDATAKSFEKFDLKLDSARVKFSLPYSVKQDENKTALVLSDAAFRLDNMNVKQKSNSKTLMRFSYFSIDGIDIDTADELLHVKNITLRKPRVYAKKYTDGRMNFDDLLLAKASTKVKEPEKTEPSPWKATIENMKIERAGLFFNDASIDTTARMKVNEFNLHVRDISSDLKHTFNYESNMRINDDGKLFLRGKVRPEPLRISSAINLQDLQISDANPYISQTHMLTLDRGFIDFKGDMHFEPQKDTSDMQMKGSIKISDFVANQSENDKTLIAFEKIQASPFYLDMKPDRLSIEDLSVSGLYSNIHIDANKTLNLSQLAKENNSSVDDINETNQTQKKPFPINIVKLDFKNGITDFADDSLPLKFKTQIHDVQGSVYGISSEANLTSYIDIAGVIDNYGSMKVAGSINSASPKTFTDIDVDFRNLALNNMSPYSANFAGRKIDEGKLSLALKYKIVESQILGDNSIIIKKIKLGEEFEGESSLPLGLAIALLEDSDGLINIDMPVEGDMDAPDFKYGALVMKTLGNLIVKIVSSPFSFLGSMLGIEGDDLKYIAYETGEATLLPPEREKLDALAKALAKRPKLSLSVSGSYALQADTYALQKQKLEALVMQRTQKKESKGLLDIKFVEALYIEFYSEDAKLKLQKELQAKHKEKKDKVLFHQKYQNQLLQGIMIKQEVSPEELKFLAKERALSIKNYLTISQGIDSNRIKLIDITTKEFSEEGFVNTEMEIIVKE